MKIKLYILIICLLHLTDCTDKDQTIRMTKYGAIQGMNEEGVFVWKGIPYAQPPIGDLRWRPPQKLAPWKGTFEAVSYGNICPQKAYGPQSIYEIPKEAMSEDCLYLNVWSPDPGPDEKLPVMVWIHGGSLTREGGSHPQYLGANLAKKGIVYVSINYRLNIFGFLAHPDLSAESPDNVSGNYGILDQIAALEWVRENISSFGGDPNKVTIAGESAGGWSVTLLMASPKAKGLFRQGILQSGAYMWSGPDLKEESNQYESGESEGLTFMGAMGVENLEELRQISSDKIVDHFFSSNNTVSGEPMIDGVVFPKKINQIFAKGNHNKADVIIGANADEWGLWVPQLPGEREDFINYIESNFGGDPSLFEQAYPIGDSLSIRKAYADYLSDDSFHLHDRLLAQEVNRGGNKVFQYYFSKVPSERYPEEYGAFHGAEIVYALDNLENDPGTIGSGTITGEDQAYADMVSAYWINFVKSGVPHGEDLPIWQEWDPKKQLYLEFGQRKIEMKSKLLFERLNAMEIYHLSRQKKVTN